MCTKKCKLVGMEGFQEIIEALEYKCKRIEDATMETIEKIDRILDSDLFNRNSFDFIQSIARKCVVNVPNLTDDKNHEDYFHESNLVIKCNERLEYLVERIKPEMFAFIENVELFRGLFDLNGIYNDNNKNNYEIQLSYNVELVQMQADVSSDYMDILNYYKNRSKIGSNLLNQPRCSDYWIELIEIDEDFFYKLRMILFNLRLFYLRLYKMMYHKM